MKEHIIWTAANYKDVNKSPFILRKIKRAEMKCILEKKKNIDF